MNLPRADAALEVCAQHLDATGSRNTEIDAILTSYVSAVIYAAFERKARQIVAERAGGDETDPHLSSFARTASTRLMRSIKIGELSGTAGYFHADCKKRFHELLDPPASAAWDSIISNRHDVAHEDDAANVVSSLTFRELEELYPVALTVLECLEQAIARAEAPAQSPDEARADLPAKGKMHALRSRIASWIHPGPSGGAD